LRLPLFWKLLVANVALVALAGVAVVWAVDRVHLPVLPAVAVVMAGTVALAALLNAVVVGLALRPVATLTATAERVRAGDWGARAGPSVFADRKIERLRHVVNEMLDAVTAARRRQRELSRQVLEAEERERERIAHELYAGTAQTLAGVLVRLRILERDSGRDPSCGPVDEVAEEVRQALEEIRAVARRLRPPELDELGVRAALEAHARRLTDGASLRMEFHGHVPETCLSDEARMALFRVVQEALTNAARHARASHVHTRFVPAADALVVEVEDDGTGFDPAEALTRSPGAGLGLPGMEERAGYAGGSLAMDTAPGHGTRLRLLLPWATPPDIDDEPAAAARARPMIPAGAPT
jgi:two-component system, NarL family, sensor histidine kinase UhpB